MTSMELDSQLNFKILILLFFVLGCGLKKPPTPPKNDTLPSVIDKYSKKGKKDGADSRSRK